MNAYLGDDGTLDTIVTVECPCGAEEEMRYSQEFAADFRDEEGTFSDSGWRGIADSAIDDFMAEHECGGEA